MTDDLWEARRRASRDAFLAKVINARRCGHEVFDRIDKDVELTGVRLKPCGAPAMQVTVGTDGSVEARCLAHHWYSGP